jgi:putative oxidoreductase
MHIFSSSTVDQAASHGVPLAPILVRIAGVFAVVGGLSIILGYKARFGAWLIILFLVPVTLMMHNFWAVSDPMMRQTQQIMFLKNISMLGGAMLIAYFGSGPYSLAR